MVKTEIIVFTQAVLNRGVSAFWIFFPALMFVCVEVLRPNGVMSSAVSLPNHTFTGQA